MHPRCWLHGHIFRTLDLANLRQFTFCERCAYVYFDGTLYPAPAPKASEPAQGGEGKG